MNKKTYFNNQYTLYQYSNKPPELHYQDFTLSLTSDGTIHLTTPSKEFDSTAHIFNTIHYWQDPEDTLIGIEIAKAGLQHLLIVQVNNIPWHIAKVLQNFFMKKALW